MTRKVNIGSGGVTADGITWSSSRWVDADHPQAVAFREFASRAMTLPRRDPSHIVVSSDFAEAFRSALADVKALEKSK